MDKYDRLLLQQLAPYLQVHLANKSDNASKELHQNFQRYNIQGTIWDNCIIKDRILNPKFVIRYIDDLESSVDTAVNPEPKHQDVHSIASPFNPQSDIYPNGLVSIKWFQKYLVNSPFAIVATYNLPPRSNSQDLGLSLLINDIIKIKEHCNSSTRVHNSNHVHFVAIIIGDSNNNEEDRISLLRSATGLLKLSGLYYLQDGPQLTRDASVLVTTLLSNLKLHAIEFYTAIESRIKSRSKKYYTFPTISSDQTSILLKPEFLVARNSIKLGMIIQFVNPQNTELCIKTLLSAYDQLIELISENFSGPMTAKDIELYQHFRLYLDILALHIVRSYMAIEDPLLALRKHKAHVENVIQVTGEDGNWRSIQYQLLAEFISLVPHTILGEARNSKKNQRKFGGPLTVYFGGVTFFENGNYGSRVVLDPGLLLLRAAKVQTMGSTGLLYPYMEGKATPPLELLLEARQEFEKHETSDDKAIKTFVDYLSCLLGQLHLEQGSYDQAAMEFKASINETQRPILLYEVMAKLLQCYKNLSDNESIIETILQMSTLDLKGMSLFFKTDAINIPKIPETTYEVDIYDVKTAILHAKLQTISLYDKCTFQLEITPVIHFDKLRKLLNIDDGKKDLQIIVKELRVKFDGTGGSAFKDVNLVSRGLGKILNYTTIDEDGSGTISVQFSDRSTRIVQFEQEALVLGETSISSIEIISEIIGTSFTITTLSRQFVGCTHDVKLYQFNGKDYPELTHYKNERVRIFSGSVVNIEPVTPNISIVLENEESISNIVLEEKLKIEVLFNVEKQRGVEYNKLAISTLASFKDPSILIRAYWEGLKDDESLPLNTIMDNVSNKKRTLYIQLEKPPSLKTVVSGYLDVYFQIVEIAHERIEQRVLPSPVLLKTFQTAYLDRPFKCDFAIKPRFRNDDDSIDLPNPFVIQDESAVTMPVSVRVWEAKVELDTQFEIVSKSLLVRSMNPEVQANVVQEGGFNVIFTTSSRTGYSHRNVVIISRLILGWKRPNSDIVNEYQSEEWEVTLPLSDPRVLLWLTEEERDGKGRRLKYVIENPTPRIFSFTGMMQPSSNWVTEPQGLPSGTFPVLPFQRYFFSVYSGLAGEGEVPVIQLPQLEVFDVNYKVNLPTLSVDDKVENRDGKLYIKHE